MTGPRGRIFTIGCGAATDPAASPEAMGFKACNLLRLGALGVPVPPAFVLGTGFCAAFHASEGREAPGFADTLAQPLRELEHASGLAFGDARKPLLVSVRSGAPVSMPGMMETILDVGLNEATVRGLLRLTGNPRLAWDSYRRLVQSFGEVVHGLPAAPFDERLAGELERSGAGSARELDFRSLRR